MILRTGLWGLILVSVTGLVDTSGKELAQIAPLCCSMAGAAALLLFLLGRLTLASYWRREALAKTHGLPPDLAALLRDECFNPGRAVSERGLIVSSEGRLPIAEPPPAKVRAKPAGATLPANPVRRTCAWFFDSLVALKYPCLLLEACLAGVQIRGLVVHDPDSGRALHDWVSRTQVVRLPCSESARDGR